MLGRDNLGTRNRAMRESHHEDVHMHGDDVPTAPSYRRIASLQPIHARYWHITLYIWTQLSWA